MIIGRSIKKKNSISGIKRVYLMPYVKYSKTQFIGSDELIISFPVSTLYKFDLVIGSTFSEEVNTVENGQYIDQKLDITLQKVDYDMNYQFNRIINRSFRAIVEDNNGNLRMVGLYNGLDPNGSVKNGTNKEDFSGYNISFEGKERKLAPFIDNINDHTIHEGNVTFMEDVFVDGVFL